MSHDQWLIVHPMDSVIHPLNKWNLDILNHKSTQFHLVFTMEKRLASSVLSTFRVEASIPQFILKLYLLTILFVKVDNGFKIKIIATIFITLIVNVVV